MVSLNFFFSISLNDLDSLSESIDKFSNVLSEIELKLASKEPFNKNDASYMNSEIDSLQVSIHPAL